MKNVEIVICGLGGVGREFIHLITERQAEIESKYNLRLRLTAAVDIGGAAINTTEMGLDGDALLSHLKGGSSIEIFGEWGRPGLSGVEVIAESGAKVLIETTPTNLVDGGVAKGHVLTALENGMEVVSANKGPFVLFYDEVHNLAAKNNCGLHISATTAAALPTLDVGRKCLAGTRLISVEGILNGTTNYILSEMHIKGTSYDEALKEAQEMGIAETNPSYDVEGKDTASKIVLICNRLFGTSKTLNDIDVKGITKVSLNDISDAKKVGKVIKLIGAVEKNGEEINLSVGPKLLNEDHPLAKVGGSAKAITYDTDTMGEITVMGGKSSQVGAAAALLKDLINAFV